MCLRFRANLCQLLKDPVILGPAIRITGAIFGYRADKNGRCANHFRPTHGDRKEVSIAKRNVGYRNRISDHWFVRLILGHIQALIRKRGPSDRLQMIQLHYQPLAYPKEIGKRFECRSFAPLGTLAIAGM